MTIIELAMQREKEAETYYRDLAKKSQDAGLRNIMTRLADMEVRHYKALKSLVGKSDAEVADAAFLPDMKTFFGKLRDAATHFKFDVSQLELYKLAQNKEADALHFYDGKAAEAGTREAAAVFKRLAQQEQVHFQILGTIIDFVSRPLDGHWLENAEWYHRDEY